MALVDRIRRGWNAFTNLKEPVPFENYGATYSSIMSDRSRPRFVNESSIVGSIYTRIAIDVSDAEFWHVRTDENGRFEKTGLPYHSRTGLRMTWSQA